MTQMGYREILKAIRRECSQQGYSITPRYRVHADHRGSALYRQIGRASCRERV